MTVRPGLVCFLYQRTVRRFINRIQSQFTCTQVDTRSQTQFSLFSRRANRGQKCKENNESDISECPKERLDREVARSSDAV